jgi:hypothetical protein
MNKLDRLFDILMSSQTLDYGTDHPRIVVNVEAKFVINAINELAQLRDNYKATQELLAIREEQIGEFLHEKDADGGITGNPQ